MTLKPLACAECHGPTPLTDAETTPCPFCGKPVPIPGDYRALLAAQRKFEATAARAPLWKEFGRPPAWALRTLAAWFSPLALFAFMFAASPLIGMALVAGLGLGLQHALRTDLFEVYADFPWYWTVLFVGFAFVWAGALGGVAGTRRALALGPLQAALAARPPERAGGVAACRRCGAPLTYDGRDLGVRCAYCETDNLLKLPRDWVRRMKGAADDSVRELANVEQTWAAERARLRRYRQKLVLGLAVPTVLFTLAVRDDLANGRMRGPAAWTWDRMRSERAVRLYTATKPGNQPYWYAEQVMVTPDELGRVVTQTTGPHCSDAFCLVSLDFAVKAGERWSVNCSPIDARVVVHEVRMLGPAVKENWQKDWPGGFDQAPLAVGTCGGLAFDSSWTGLLRAVVQLQGGAPERPVELWVTEERLSAR